MILSKRAKELLKARREIRDMQKAGYTMLTPHNTSNPFRVVSSDIGEWHVCMGEGGKA